MLHGAGPTAGTAVCQLVTLLLSLGAPSPGAEGARCAKSCGDSNCLGGFSMAAPSSGLADVGPLPGPAAAHNGEELGFQWPSGSLSSVSVDIIPTYRVLPLHPLDALSGVDRMGA